MKGANIFLIFARINTPGQHKVQKTSGEHRTSPFFVSLRFHHFSQLPSFDLQTTISWITGVLGIADSQPRDRQSLELAEIRLSAAGNHRADFGVAVEPALEERSKTAAELRPQSRRSFHRDRGSASSGGEAWTMRRNDAPSARRTTFARNRSFPAPRTRSLLRTLPGEISIRRNNDFHARHVSLTLTARNWSKRSTENGVNDIFHQRPRARLSLHTFYYYLPEPP